MKKFLFVLNFENENERLSGSFLSISIIGID